MVLLVFALIGCDEREEADDAEDSGDDAQVTDEGRRGDDLSLDLHDDLVTSSDSGDDDLGASDTGDVVTADVTEDTRGGADSSGDASAQDTDAVSEDLHASGDLDGGALDLDATDDIDSSGDLDAESGGDYALPQTCEDLIAAIQAELLAVRSCDEAAECGQVIYGSSCGCTRNLVARLGADLGRYEAPYEAINGNECDWGLISTCDCPPADGYACTGGYRGWNYL